MPDYCVLGHHCYCEVINDHEVCCNCGHRRRVPVESPTIPKETTIPKKKPYMEGNWTQGELEVT